MHNIRMDFLTKLKPPDYISITGLFFAWLSILALLFHAPFIAIPLSMIGFACDVLDGFVARKCKINSPFGRELDSFVDVCCYVVFSAMLFTIFISPSILMSVIVGFSLVFFGGMRLIRFNQEGILRDKEKSYYRGLTVVHIYLLTILGFFILQKIPHIAWPFSAFLFLISFFQLSNFKSYKITNPLFFIGIITLSVICSIYFFYGN